MESNEALKARIAELEYELAEAKAGKEYYRDLAEMMRLRARSLGEQLDAAT